MSGTSPDSVAYPIVGYGMAVALDDGNGTYNWATLTESGTGQPARVLANGYDANVSLSLVPKGTGSVTFGANYANYVTITGAAAGSSPTITTAGANTSIPLAFTPKGGAVVRFNGPILQQYTHSPTSTLTPFITANQTINGTYTTGDSFQNNFNVDDKLNASGPGSSNWFYMQHSMGNGFQGNRSSFRLNSYILARPADYAAGSKYYVGWNGEMSVRADISNGAGTKYGTAIGFTYETNVKSGAKIALAEAVELGAGVETGGEVSRVNVLKLSPLGGGIAPTGSFNGLALSHAGAGQGFFVGIAIGGQEGTAWPISSTGKIIAITDPTGSPAKTVDYGIDFATVPCTFTTAAFASPGFQVDGSGRTTGAAFILTSGGPRIVQGSGAPSALLVLTKGSLYLRNDGAVGSTLYVTQGGGTWNAVAGV